MIAECHITCGSWGAGLVAYDRLAHMLPWVTLAICFVALIWIATRRGT